MEKPSTKRLENTSSFLFNASLLRDLWEPAMCGGSFVEKTIESLSTTTIITIFIEKQREKSQNGEEIVLFHPCEYLLQ